MRSFTSSIVMVRRPETGSKYPFHSSIVTGFRLSSNDRELLPSTSSNSPTSVSSSSITSCAVHIRCRRWRSPCSAMPMAHRARYSLALSNSSCSVWTSGLRSSLLTCGGVFGLSRMSCAALLVRVVTLENLSMMFHPVSLMSFTNGSIFASLALALGPGLASAAPVALPCCALETVSRRPIFAGLDFHAKPSRSSFDGSTK